MQPVESGISRWLKAQRTKLALAATLVWLLGFALWTLLWEPPVRGNEWGDWAAGMFAPVAFFWLVLGYFQQGEELRQNTEALKMQQQELKNQVAETAILAANSARQAVAAEQMVSATLEEKQRIALREQADALPIFRMAGVSTSPNGVRMTLRNAGATVTNLSVESLTEGVKVRIEPSGVLESGGDAALKVGGTVTFPISFELSFTDRLGKLHARTYEMTAPNLLEEISSG